MPNNLHIASRLGAIEDVARSFLFEVSIPEIDKMTDYTIDMEGMTIRTKSAIIPPQGVETIDSFFMGMVQKFPGRSTFGGNTLSVMVDETEDQKVLQALYAWKNRIFNTNPTGLTPGYSAGKTKKDYSTKIIVNQIRYNGEYFPNKIIFHNAMLTEIPEVGLEMTGSEKISFNPTFTWDYWTLESN